MAFERSDFTPAQLEIEAQSTPCPTILPTTPDAPVSDDEHFVVDIDTALDTVFTSTSSFDIPLTRYYFHPDSFDESQLAFDVSGFLTPASITDLLLEGAFPATAQLTLAVYDVDTQGLTNTGCTNAESINIDLNGLPLLNTNGQGVTLSGQADKWETITFEFPISYLKFPQSKGSNSLPPTPANNNIKLILPECSDGIAIAWSELALVGAIRPIITIPGWTNEVPSEENLRSGFFGFRNFYVTYALESHLPIQIPEDYEKGIKTIDETYPIVVQQIQRTQVEFGVDKVNIFGHSRGGLFTRRAVSEEGMSNAVEHVFTFASPHHGSTSNSWSMGIGSIVVCLRNLPSEDRADCIKSARSLKVPQMRNFNFAECDTKLIYSPTLYQMPEEFPSNSFERDSSVIRFRDCEPNTKTWEQDEITYFSIAGLDDILIGVDVTAMYIITSFNS